MTSLAVSSIRSQLKERSQRRRQLLAQSLGAKTGTTLSQVLGNATERRKLGEKRSKNVKDLQKSLRSKSTERASSRQKSSSAGSKVTEGSRRKKRDGSADSEDVEIEDYYKVLKAEELKEHQSFLKGTQSDNPHNDYCQHFVDTGQRPQNFIRDAGLAERFEEYPKLKELIKLKDELVANTATPPMYLRCDLQEYDLSELGSKFDVIIVDPPLEEYQRIGAHDRQFWSWDMVSQLNIPAIADWRCFIWLWCGSSPEGLDWGRHCLKQWGFRRCEDICWIKTNAKNREKRGYVDPKSIAQRTKEHCLMGIKGTVRRSTDGDYIHANVDIDLIISEEPEELGNIEKPTEIFLIAEHFCLGRRRLHVFGRDMSIRPGWLTIGPELTSTNFDPIRYRNCFDKPDGATTGCTDRIEQLRPKSPPPRGGGGPQGGGGGGGGQGGFGGGGFGQGPPLSGGMGSTGGGGYPLPPLLPPMPNSGGGGNRGRAGWGPGWKGRNYNR